jgi:hypothetical protein
MLSSRSTSTSGNPPSSPDVANSTTPIEIKERNEYYLQERVGMTTTDVMFDVLQNAFGVNCDEGSVTKKLEAFAF